MLHFVDREKFLFHAPDCTYRVHSFTELLTTEHKTEHGVLSLTSETGDVVVRFIPDEDTAVFPEDMNRPRIYRLTELCYGRLIEILKEGPANYWFALDMASRLKY